MGHFAYNCCNLFLCLMDFLIAGVMYDFPLCFSFILIMFLGNYLLNISTNLETYSSKTQLTSLFFKTFQSKSVDSDLNAPMFSFVNFLFAKVIGLDVDPNLEDEKELVIEKRSLIELKMMPLHT